MITRSLALGILVTLAPAAVALDKHQPKTPVYPKSEAMYIKRFTEPQINCGTCFGYYKPHWRSWNEACGEPEVVYASGSANVPAAKPAEAKVEKAPDAVMPKPAEVAPLPVPKAMDPIPLIDPKPIEPKKVEPGQSGLLPVPLPATPVSVSIPEPEAPSIPLIPMIPIVNIK